MAASNGGGRDSAPIITQGQEHEKPKGLIDFLSELEYYYTQELNGMKIDGGLFTSKDKLHSMELGFRSTFASGLVMALLTPISIGVVEKMIPIFGDSNPTAYDNLFVMLLTLFYLIGYGYFLGWGCRCWYSDYTHSMVKNLLGGIVGAAVLKMGIVFILFHSIYIKLLTPEIIVKIAVWLAKGISPDKLAGPCHWLLNFRSVFISSAWFVVVTTLIWLTVILGCYYSAVRRNKKLKETALV